MSGRRSLAAAVGWFALVGVGWGLYWRHRFAEDDRREHEYSQWVEAIRTLHAPAEAPPSAGAAPPVPAPLPDAARGVDRARLLADVEALAFERWAPADRARARGRVAHTLQAEGWTPELMAFEGGVNVEVERPGLDPKAGVVLLGAHYDSRQGSPGADDDASGVAVVLEAARLLRTPTRRGLRLVFFDAEERGLLGSRAYAQSDARIADLRAVVVVEMVGYACHVEGCQAHPEGLPVVAPKVGNFIAIIGDLEHLGLLWTFRRARRPEWPPLFTLPVPAQGRPLPDTRRSDHAPFWDRGVGAVLVTDTAELRNPHYHLPGDTPATLDPAFLEGAAGVVIEGVRRLLAEE